MIRHIAYGRRFFFGSGFRRYFSIFVFEWIILADVRVTLAFANVYDTWAGFYRLWCDMRSKFIIRMYGELEAGCLGTVSIFAYLNAMHFIDSTDITRKKVERNCWKDVELSSSIYAMWDLILIFQMKHMFTFDMCAGYSAATLFSVSAVCGFAR